MPAKARFEIARRAWTAVGTGGDDARRRPPARSRSRGRDRARSRVSSAHSFATPSATTLPARTATRSPRGCAWRRGRRRSSPRSRRAGRAPGRASSPPPRGPHLVRPAGLKPRAVGGYQRQPKVQVGVGELVAVAPRAQGDRVAPKITPCHRSDHRRAMARLRGFGLRKSPGTGNRPPPLNYRGFPNARSSIKRQNGTNSRRCWSMGSTTSGARFSFAVLELPLTSHLRVKKSKDASFVSVNSGWSRGRFSSPRHRYS